MVGRQGACRWYRARAFAVALSLVACGGQSTRDGEPGTGRDAGTPSAGGTDSGGTSGLGGTQSAGGGGSPVHCAYHGRTYALGESFLADDGCNRCTCTHEGPACTTVACPDTSCDRLRADYEAALALAKSCDPARSGPTCDRLYPSTLPCGCPTFVNESPELDAYFDEWVTRGCPQLPCPPCDSPTGAYCSDSGRCEDSFGPPRCDGGLVSPSPICDYGVSCTDAQSCLHGDCYVPGTGENPVCSRRCNTANDCPTGTACVEVGGDGSHCFIRCTSDELCLSINSAPENPLVCVSFGDERVCIQRSEP